MSSVTPNHSARWALPLAAALLITAFAAACSKQEAASPAGAPTSGEAAAADSGVVGTRNQNGSQLAYEHDIRVRLEAAKIAKNLGATRDACMSQRFGECSLLGEDLGAGEQPTGQLQMRAVPAAVAGLVGLASQGGSIAQRSTRAEDLADAVRDNGMRRKRLELQHDKLAEILDRRDLKAEDLFTITERMAQIEAELNGAEQEAAQQQRRIATNLLTIHFETTNITAESSKIGQALRGMTSTWDGSMATLISVLGALLPFVLLSVLAALVWCAIARRKSNGPD
jgi:hypothetical protein